VRRLIATVNTSLDGYMEGPGGDGDLGWVMPFVDDGLADNAALLARTDTILLGRVTYEGFSRFWPAQEGAFAALMNEPRKVVFASPGSLSSVEWGKHGNAVVVDRDVEETVKRMKNEQGPDVVVLASGALVSSLLPFGIVDELQLVVVPVLLGSGKPYLRGIDSPLELELAEATQYPKGSTRLTYRVSTRPA
jgi:dihydrofolate reductase